MKYIFSFLILFLLLNSCTDPSDLRIKKFEEVVGKDKIDALNKGIQSFESYLKETFKDIPIQEAYKKYLEAIIYKDSQVSINFNDSNFIAFNAFFEKSELKNEIWLKVDSIKIADRTLNVFQSYDTLKSSYEQTMNGFDKFIEADSFVSYLKNGPLDDFLSKVDTFIIENDVVKFYELNDTLVFLSKQSIPNKYLNYNEDSIICFLNEHPNFNIQGSFIKGLELIQEPDSTIIGYIKSKKIIHNTSPFIIADGLLKQEIDYSDYFIKRIVLIELYSRGFN